MLDWTENPLVALFFAVENYRNSKDGKLFVIHPAEFNNTIAFSPHNNIEDDPETTSVPTSDQSHIFPIMSLIFLI